MLALLAGKAINLDSVFAADHSTSINEVQTHEISEGIAIRLTKTCPTLLKLRESSVTQMNGQLPGTPTPKPSSLLSCIATKSSPSISNTCHPSSEQLLSPSTVASSSSIEQSTTVLVDVAISSSQKPTNSRTLSGRTSRPLHGISRV